jgi:ATP-dependent RNA helicase RhlE
MLDLGFIHSLKRISQMLPKKRQTLFFSATMPKTIAELGDRFLTDPVKVAVTPVASTAERVEQFVTFVNQAEKQALLTLTLKAEPIDRALVFTRTKHGADKVVKHLQAAGIGCAAIHGTKSQPQRTQALQAFRAGEIKILVATDIAARGIDVSGVSHVFNFELPNVAEQYVHRIGRTARAGRDGIAISFVDGEERAYLRQIERLIRLTLPATRSEIVGQPVSPKQFQGAERRHAERDQRRGRPNGGQHRHQGQQQSHGKPREQNEHRSQEQRPHQSRPQHTQSKGGAHEGENRQNRRPGKRPHRGQRGHQPNQNRNHGPRDHDGRERNMREQSAGPRPIAPVTSVQFKPA